MESSHAFGAVANTDLGAPQFDAPPDTIEAINEALIDDLVTSPHAPRELLIAALKESRRRFDSLLSSVSGSFYRCNLVPQQANQLFEVTQNVGGLVRSNQFEETRFRELIHPDDLRGFDRAIHLALHEEHRFEAQFRVRTKHGEWRWKSAHGNTVRDADGGPLAVEGCVTDITESMELKLESEAAQEATARLNAKLTQVLESTLDCVMSFDRDWHLTFANRRARDEIGRNGYSEWRGNLADFEPVKPTFFWDVLQHVMAKREPRRAEGHMPELDVWWELYAVPDEDDGITVFFRNISERKRLEQELQNQASFLRTTLDSIPDMAWVAGADGRGQFFNRSWNEFIGRPARELKEANRRPTVDWMHADDIPLAMAQWQRAFETGGPFEARVRLAHHSGEFRWVLARAWPQIDESGAMVRWFGSATDIHDGVIADQKLRESEILQGSLLDSTPDYVQILDLDGRLLKINNSVLHGMDLEDSSVLLGTPWADHWPKRCRKAIRRTLAKARDGKVARFDAAARNAQGVLKWWDNIFSPIRDDDGQVRRLLCISRDITKLKATTERLRQASEQDFLTSLPNRRAFKQYLSKAVARAREQGNGVGLMLLDLDHFKHVNDTLGHLAGDHVLRVIAKRLAACLAGIGFVARLGGDEFAVVLSGITEEMELVRAATRVLAHLDMPVKYQGTPVSSGISIGCAMFPRDAVDGHGLLKHADMSLYDLKASGRGGIQMFDAELKEAVERTANQLNVARRVIHDSAVEPFYQPKIRLDTGAVSGFEALLRWWCPGNGLQLPATVAEAFNDYELSTRIGTLMQNRVFADMASWLESGHKLLPVSINASPAEFLRDDYAERLLGRIGEFGLAPSLIEVEITEHVFLERRSQQVVRALRMLKDAGVKIALDDFGTGHSSLSHLRDFPVDVLKIDRSFISRMLGKPAIMAIVKAIMRLGPSLDLTVVAEGVESPEQLEFLRKSGCGYGQGYLFGKAVDAQEATRWLASPQWPLKLPPRLQTSRKAA